MAAIGLFNDIAVFITIGHIFTLPMIGLWYGFKRKWQTSYIDRAVYLAFFVGSFSDSFILIGGQTGEILQICTTIIMHTIVIAIFRKEGTRIYSDKLKDLPKLLIPISIIFIFFGAVMIPILPDVIYFIAIFYAVQEMILVSHGFFREVKGKSYVWVATGVSLLMVKDGLYCYIFFMNHMANRPLYIIEYTLSTTVYFMIAVGIAINQQNTEKIKSETLLEYLRNYLKKSSKVRYAKHSHKYLFNRREDSQQTQLN